MKVTFEPKEPLPPNVQKYLEMFGHLPSIEAMKFLKPEELDKQAKEANEKGGRSRNGRTGQTGRLVRYWTIYIKSDVKAVSDI